MKDSPNIRIKVPSFISSRQNAWFFQRLGEPVEFRADQLIAMPGMYPQYCYFLKTGRVIAGIVSSANRQRLMLSFEDGSLLARAVPAHRQALRPLLPAPCRPARRR